MEGIYNELDLQIASIKPEPNIYKQFRMAVWKSAKKHIPRGCRTEYIPCLTDQGKILYNDYKKAYESDPFAEETIQLGEALMSSVSERKSEKWRQLI